MNIKDLLGGIVAVLVCSSMCVQCTSMHMKGSNKEAVEHYEKMIAEKTTAVATLQPSYKETTIKVLHVPIKTYTFNYLFKVDGQIYSGEQTYQTELPKTDTLTVSYLREDPSINCSNPESLLKSEKENGTSKTNLIAAIIWGLLAAVTFLGVLASFKQAKPKQE